MSSSVRSFRTARTAESQQTGLGLGLIKANTMSKYMSFDLKIQRFLLRTESILFGTMYSVVQENSFRIKFALLGVFIDFLQVMAFTLSEDFGWFVFTTSPNNFNRGPEFDLIAAWALGPVRAMTWSSFTVAFWITVCFIASAFIVGYYVGYHFAAGDFARIWPMKYMRTVVNLLMGVLFIPVITILLVPLKINSDNTLRNFPDVVAWGPDATLYAIVSLITLVIFTPFCLLLGMMNFEFGSRSRDFMARHTSWFDFIYLVLKTVLTLITNLVVNAASMRVIVMLLATGFVIFFVFILVPYYSIRINVLRGGLFAGLFGASLSTAVKVFSNDIYATVGLSIGSVFGFHLAFTAVFGVLGAIIMWIRLKRNLSTASVYQYIAVKSNKQQPGTPTWRRGDDIQMTRISRAGSRDDRTHTGSARSSLIRVGTNSIQQTPSREHKSSFAKIWQAIKGVFLVADIMARTRFLQDQGNKTDDLIRLADSVFQKALDRNSQTPSLLIHYANFATNWKEDWLLAIAQLRKANAFKIGFYHRWLSYTVAKRVERMRRASQVGGLSNSVDLMKYIEFQHSMEKAKKYHFQSLHYLRTFWETLLTSTGDKMLKNMSDAQALIGRAQSRALYAYSRLISKFPSSPVLWRSYGTFLRDVVIETDEAEEAFNTADDIEDQRNKHNAAVRARASGTASLPPISPDEDSIDATIRDVDGEDGSEHSHSGGESMQSRSIHTKSATSTSATTLRRRLGTKGARDTISSLHMRLMITLAMTGLVLALQAIVSNTILNNAMVVFDASETVLDMQTQLVWTMHSVNDLVLDRYLNGTDVGLGAASWTFTNGVTPAARIAVIKAKLANASKTVDMLYGTSKDISEAIALAWDAKSAVLEQWSSVTNERIASLKTTPYRAFTLYIQALGSIVSSVERGEIGIASIPANVMYQFALFNTETELGGAFKAMITAYHGTLDDTRMQLFIWITVFLVLVSGLGLISVMLVVVPGLRAVHLDLHMAHALLSTISADDIEAIRNKAAHCENDMMSSLTIDGTDDQQSVHNAAEETPIRPERRHKRITVGGDDAIVFKTAKQHVKKCNEMIPLAFWFVLTVGTAVGLSLSVTLTVSSRLSNDWILANQAYHSNTRLRVASVEAMLSWWLPQELTNVFNGEWGGALRHTLDQKATRMAEVQIWTLMGVNQTHGKAYPFNSEHIPNLTAESVVEVNAFQSSMSALMAKNSTELNLANPHYTSIREFVTDREVNKTAIERMTLKYVQQADIEHDDAERVTLTVTIFLEIWLLLVGYLILIRNYIVPQLEERSSSSFRMLKMIPNDVFRSQPLIREFIKDRSTMLERIKESARSQQSKGKDNKVDATLLPNYITESHSPYVVVKMDRDVAYLNAAAQRMFRMKAGDKWGKSIDHLVHSAHVNTIMAGLNEASECMNTNVVKRIVGLNHEGASIVLDADITCVQSSRKMYVIRFTAIDDTQHDKGVDKLVAAASSVLWRRGPVIIVSPAGQVLALNDEAGDLLPGIHIPCTFESIFNSESSTAATDLVRKSLTDYNRSTSRRLALVNSNLPVRATVMCSMFKSVDAVQYLVVTLENLVDSIAIESSVRHLEAMDRALMQSLPEGVLVVDKAEDVVTVNDAALSIFGYATRDVLLGQKASTLFDGGMSVIEPNKWKRVSIRRRDGSEGVAEVFVQQLGDDSESRLVFARSP